MKRQKIFLHQRYDIKVTLFKYSFILQYECQYGDGLTGLTIGKPDRVNFDWSGYIYQPVRRIGVQNVEQRLQVIGICRKIKYYMAFFFYQNDCMFPICGASAYLQNYVEHFIWN